MPKAAQFLTGAETIIQATLSSGAELFFGYPITPGTELLSLWSRQAAVNKKLIFLQTEDEIAAGFALNGAVLSGRIAFTATAGPGTILMQDPLVMAEAMRLPVVLIIIQRGGPSSGTVIYSQQEVNLAIFGGNNEGMRLVYSPSNLRELYYYTQKSFVNAWQYRFPAIILTDGYLMKTRANVEFLDLVEKPVVQPVVKLGANQHLPNIFTLEEELFDRIQKDAADFQTMAKEVVEFESFEAEEAEILIVAHGIVGAGAKQAVSELRAVGKKVGLFRPITLNPFPSEELNRIARTVKKIVVVESSLGQLERLVRSNLETAAPIEHYLRPAMGIEVEEITNFVNKRHSEPVG